VTVALTLMVAMPAAAQTSEFHCPPDGTIVEYADGARTIWDKREGEVCKGRFSSGGTTSAFNWYAPAFGLEGEGPRFARGQALVAQFKPGRIWPLTVGKKVTGRYEGVSGSGDPPRGVWDHTVTIEAYEKVTTKAGTFDTFVVSHEDLAISHSYKYVERSWYAPVPGVTIKSAVTSSAGLSRTREAVSIGK
jgi:hypothetical protein